MGGYPDDTLFDYVLGLAPGKRVLYVVEPSGETRLEARRLS